MDTLTLILPTLDDCLRLARGCGYVVGVQTPFRDSDRVWIDLAVKGHRPTGFITGPQVNDYAGQYRVGFVLRDIDGQKVAPSDPVAVAKGLKLTYQTAPVRAREAVS